MLSPSALPGVAPKLAELETLTVPFVIVVEVPRANELEDWIVPLFKIILSLSAVPGVAPKLAVILQPCLLQ